MSRARTNELAGPLAAAQEIAREAGALIRTEFHRRGGPRGLLDHAAVDDEVEAMVRTRLLEAFPDWGYRGEETGSAGVEPPPRHIWLVDPNDGTRNYLQGCRGSSVSIALLRERQPVLGVVYSPCCPDDDGDFFAWADGCGPPTRNGRPLVQRSWPKRLGADDSILVSHDADNAAESNLRCASPARYRPMPSIAYRLALAAAGDGTLGTSFKGAGDWDYAGGHALLRAVGGELYDEHGAPTSYSERGESRSRMCFGGTDALVREVLDRPWGDIYRSDQPRLTYPPFLPRAVLPLGRATSDAGLLQRAQGALLGQLAGDALGSLVEFQTAESIRAVYPNGLRDMTDGGAHGTMAGQPTDDSELALALARSIVAAGRYSPEVAARAYGYWCRSEPFDVGATTARALRRLASLGTDDEWTSGGHPSGAQRSLTELLETAADPNSQSNGSLMRASPLGIWGHRLEPDKLAELARADNRLTHPNPVCQEACATFVVAVAQAVATGAGPRTIFEFVRGWTRTAGRSAAVLAALEAAEHRPPADFQTSQGWVLIALQNTFYQLLHAPSAEEGIVATVMAGGDTDTNAAITGALLGAVHGRDSLPRRWRNLILSCRPLAGIPHVRQPRPPVFWPVDAMELAELLLIVGGAR